MILKLQITFESEDENEYLDLQHPMGISNDAFDRLTDLQYGLPLSFIGDIQDIERVEE